MWQRLYPLPTPGPPPRGAAGTWGVSGAGAPPSHSHQPIGGAALRPGFCTGPQSCPPGVAGSPGPCLSAAFPPLLPDQVTCCARSPTLGSTSGRPRTKTVLQSLSPNLLSAITMGLSGGREPPGVTRLQNTGWVSTGPTRVSVPRLTLCAVYSLKKITTNLSVCVSIY